MVSTTLPDDWTTNPLKIVQKIFDENNGSGDWGIKIGQYFNKVASEPGVIKKLPWLNETPLHLLQNNQVVRFRGMVQDMNDNEFFLDSYQVINTKTKQTYKKPGRYLDVAKCGPDEEISMEYNQSETGDRISYYCVSIPAETAWVKQVYEDSNPTSLIQTESSMQRTKRSADEDDDDMNCDMETKECSGIETTELKKKCDENIQLSNGFATSSSSSAEASNSKGNESLDLNLPIPDSKGIACNLKLYNNESYSLNDVIEAIGILSVDPLIATCENEEEMTDLSTPTLPPSLVPRLHVLTIKKMDHCNPLLSSSTVECRSSFAAVEQPEETKNTLHQILQEALLGDGVVADLLMCHLVSSVYMRQDIKPMGKFSLNISGIDKSLQLQNYTTKLYKLLELLCTQCYMLPLTIENLNNYKFIPKKNYDTNRLSSGILQVANHTHLVLDETTLNHGKLVDSGVHNVSAIAKVIKWQKVDYDFQYHGLEQLTDIPVLILSEAKAMIESDVLMKLKPQHSNVDSAFNKIESILTPEILKRIRIFITAARVSDFTLSDQMQEIIQEDFVESRKNKSGITGEDLHELLILARLLSKCAGENMLSKETWNKAKMLFENKKLRQ